MSEYCERCVHTDAEIARLTKERDGLRDEYDAYVEESRALTGEDSDAIASLRAQLADARALLERGAQLGIQSCAIEGDEWGTFAATCRAFLARTKGQNE